MNEEDRTTYLGLLRMSGEYIKAFEIIQQENETITFLFSIKFYLLAHSIELSLKAYLRYKGKTLGELKDLGHDLEDIYNKIKANFPYRLDNRAVGNIRAINPYYKDKQFEYPVIGPKDVVEVEDLKIVAKLINEATFVHIETEKSSV